MSSERRAIGEIGTAALGLRPARRSDIPAIDAMHFLSVHGLAAADYRPAEIEAFLSHLGTYDPALIDDGTYYVIEDQGRIVASGGWSQRAPHFDRALVAAAGRDFSLSPNSAKIRSVFVHPKYARQGLGSRLVRHAEAEAQAAGFRLLELWASLTGVPLYRRLGYQELCRLALYGSDDTEVPAVHMARLVGLPAGKATAA